MKKIATMTTDNQLTVKNEYDNEFIEKTEKCLQSINNIVCFNDIMSTFDNSFEELNNFLKKFEGNQIPVNEFMGKIELRINNVLSSGYKYIENIKTYFSRNLSIEDVIFYDAELHKMYDENFSYRLIYNIRNYTQHCGKPFHTIEKSKEDYKLVLSKDVFLKEHTQMQPKFRKELNKSDEDTYDVKIYLYQYYMNLNKFNKICMNYFIEFNFRNNMESAFFIVDNFKTLDDTYSYMILDNYPEKQQAKLELKTNPINYKASLYILNKYIREFKVYGYAFHCFKEAFPKTINLEKIDEISRTIDGSEVVHQENVMWVCMKKKMPLALGNFYSVYINNCIKDKFKQILNEIIENRVLANEKIITEEELLSSKKE